MNGLSIKSSTDRNFRRVSRRRFSPDFPPAFRFELNGCDLLWVYPSGESQLNGFWLMVGNP